MNLTSILRITPLLGAGFFLLQKPLAQNCHAQDKTSLSSQDKTFLNDAAESVRAEVDLSQLTTGRASKTRIMEFAQQMVRDHGLTYQQLQKLAQGLGYNLSDHLSAQQHAEKAKLAAISGSQFDHCYIQTQVQDLRKEIVEFKREADEGEDPQVQAFAEKTLPVLEVHLRLAESIYRDINGQSAAAVGP